MKLSDFVTAQRQEKALARQVGKHLAHMIWLFAKSQWDAGKANAYKNFDDFWAHYSSNAWKKDFWSEKFSSMVDDAIETQLTKEDASQLREQLETMKIHQLLETKPAFSVAKTVVGNVHNLVKFTRDLGLDFKEFRDWSPRMWTRGDGKRFKDPCFVQYNNNHDAERIFNLLPGKSLEVKDVFGSSQFSKAKTSNGYLFILRDPGRIDVASDSILRNSDVWDSKKS